MSGNINKRIRKLLCEENITDDDILSDIATMNNLKNIQISLIVGFNDVKKIVEYFKNTKNNPIIQELPIIQEINQLYPETLISIFNENKLNNEIYKLLLSGVKYYTYSTNKLRSIIAGYIGNQYKYENLLKSIYSPKIFYKNLNKKTINIINDLKNIMEPEKFYNIINYLKDLIINYYFKKIFKYNSYNNNTLILQIFYVIYINFIKKMVPNDLKTAGPNSRFVNNITHLISKYKNNEDNNTIFIYIFTNILGEIFVPPGGSSASYFFSPNKSTTSNSLPNETSQKKPFHLPTFLRTLLSSRPH